ncbi:hypothetical protein CDAR_291161 [Caerostris darwini]|uniref:Uncharacterized protein n=1 Tax=Caerostris darwini TaxID=1538125 RepID=A0AAV4RII9_9ARAC|nr:hypothetical protein CDAR_291161 [Caerostris darwini]
MEFAPIVFLFLVVLGAVQGSPYLVEGDYGVGEYGDKLEENLVYEKLCFEASLFKCCTSSGAVAFEEEGAATTARTTAALALPAAATCGAPTADAKEQVSSSAGARSELSSSAHSSLIFSVSAFVRICDSLSSKYKCHL